MDKKLLHELFEYKDGYLFWKNSKRSGWNGKKAGSLDRYGYLQTKIEGKLYLNHRIIFLMGMGFLPEVVDHIDGNSLNNDINNLRESTSCQNAHNARIRKDNKSGIKNVCWHKSIKKWAVRINVNGYCKNIGYFDDVELADLVAQEARDKYHGEYARHE